MKRITETLCLFSFLTVGQMSASTLSSHCLGLLSIGNEIVIDQINISDAMADAYSSGDIGAYNDLGEEYDRLDCVKSNLNMTIEADCGTNYTFML